jgi:uncharacterized membrane protein
VCSSDLAACAGFLADQAPATLIFAGPALTPMQLQRLRQELRENRLSALDISEQLEAGLRQALGEETHVNFLAALQDLRFAEALQLLPTSLP